MGSRGVSRGQQCPRGLTWPMAGAVTVGWWSLCTRSLAQELGATSRDSASSPGQTCSRELARLTC